MAFHEQHERKCPACGEPMSATAPRCLNCGRFVDGREEAEDEQPERSRAGWVWGVVLVGAVIGLGLIAYFQRGRPAPPPPQVEIAVKLADMMTRMAGRGAVNRSSPMNLAELEPQLRVGMPFTEVSALVARKNDGPNNSTVMTSVPLPGGPEDDVEEEKPRPQAHIIFLGDANLIVMTDAQEKVTTWQSRPIP
jgi:hypothetical protein